MTHDWQILFDEMHPNFFAREYIRAIPKENTYSEMALSLPAFSELELSIPVPPGTRFGLWKGDLDTLREYVAQVDPGWVKLYDGQQRVLCGFAGDELASFCMLEDFGEHGDMRIAGPGCVGTLPAFRRKGIGLRMIQLATRMLRDDGYDLSWIHYTGVAPWYARLGYKTVLTWGAEGVRSVAEPW